MNDQEVKSLAQEAWDKEPAMRVLADHLIENGIIEVESFADVHKSFRRSLSLHVIEEKTRRWILEQLGINGSLISHPIWLPGSCPPQNYLQQCRRYAFVIKQHYHNERIILKPTPMLLEYDSPPAPEFSFLDTIFKNIRLGQTKLDAVMDRIAKHSHPNLVL